MPLQRGTAPAQAKKNQESILFVGVSFEERLPAGYLVGTRIWLLVFEGMDNAIINGLKVVLISSTSSA